MFLAAVFSINIFFWMLRTTIQSEHAFFIVVESWKRSCKFEFSFPSSILTQYLPVLPLISIGSCPSTAISSLLAAELLNIPTANRWGPGTLCFFLTSSFMWTSSNEFELLQNYFADSKCLSVSLLSTDLPIFVWDLLQRSTSMCAARLVRCHYKINLAIWQLVGFILSHMHKKLCSENTVNLSETSPKFAATW